MAERERIERAVAEFYDYAGDLLARRRKDPGDDLISTLIAARFEGDKLSDAELVNLVLNVLVGGVDTTQSQLAQGIRLFAEHPDQWDLVARRPRRDGAARGGGGPALRADHAVHRPHRGGGAGLPRRRLPGRHRGDGLRVHRQPRPGSQPDVFDVAAEREARPLTFGAGIHYCLGANLARAELQEALAFLARRWTRIELDGEPFMGSINGIYGIDTLPIRWTA